MNNISIEEPKDRFIDFADKNINKLQSYLSSDLESQIDRVGRIATILDWGVYAVAAGVQAVILVDRALALHLDANPGFSLLHSAFKMLALPLTLFFFAMAFVEGTVEVLNLKRSILLLNKMQKQTDPVEKMLSIQRKYLCLKPQEEKRIRTYVEQKFPNLSHFEKVEKKDQIANKLLKLKFESLGRRITSGLAKEVASEINIILKDMQNKNPEIRKKTLEKAEHLMQSVTRQTKNKIVVHILALSGIALTIIGISALFLGVTSFAFLFTLGTTATTLMIGSYIFRKGTLSAEVSRLYDRIKPIKAEIASLLKSQGAL